MKSPEVDISINVELLFQGPFQSGQQVTYEIEVSNNGPDNAKNVIIEGVSENIDFVSLSSSSCQPAQLPCTIKQLNNGDVQTITYQARIGNAGNFNFTASAMISTEIELNPADNIDANNNSSNITPTVIPTLSQWSQALLALLMSFAALRTFSRRKN